MDNKFKRINKDNLILYTFLFVLLVSGISIGLYLDPNFPSQSKKDFNTTNYTDIGEVMLKSNFQIRQVLEKDIVLENNTDVCIYKFYNRTATRHIKKVLCIEKRYILESNYSNKNERLIKRTR